VSQISRGVTNKYVSVTSKYLVPERVNQLHFEAQSTMESLLLARDIVTVELVILLFPESKKFCPNKGKSAERPACHSVGTCDDFSKADVVVLFGTPL
jgi:hypothetical protein